VIDMTKRVMRCGIMSRKDFMERTIQIAKKEYVPKKNEPKIYFESIQSMAHILNDANLELLKIIVEKQPESITSLAAISGRKKSNLSRTLKKMEQYGIVSLEKHRQYRKPIVNVTDFNLEYGVYSQS